MKRRLTNPAVSCMMRLFIKPSCRTNLLRSLRKDCISRSLQSSYSLLSTQAISHPGNRRVRVLFLPLPQIPRPPFSPVSMGRGSFEGSLPPSQLQVESILGWHWLFWSSFGAEAWTVEVLHPGYLIPFHHLPPLAQDPLPAAQGLHRLRPFSTKWTGCCRKVPWNWFTNLAQASTVICFWCRRHLGLMACDRLVESERICYPHQVTPYFRLSPSCGLSVSGLPSCLSAKVRITAMAPTNPLVAKIWVRSVEHLFMFLSLQSSFEGEVSTRLLLRVYAI